MNKGTIKCDVAACKHNNCDNGCCELNEVKISSTCNGDCCKKPEETICQSFIKATVFVAAFFVLPLYSAFFEISSKT